MIILGAGLKDIPPELYEAATLDGASRWRQFRSVTVPLLSPSIFFVLIVTTISQLPAVRPALRDPRQHATRSIPKTMSLVYLFYSDRVHRQRQGLRGRDRDGDPPAHRHRHARPVPRAEKVGAGMTRCPDGVSTRARHRRDRRAGRRGRREAALVDPRRARRRRLRHGLPVPVADHHVAVHERAGAVRPADLLAGRAAVGELRRRCSSGCRSSASSDVGVRHDHPHARADRAVHARRLRVRADAVPRPRGPARARAVDPAGAVAGLPAPAVPDRAGARLAQHPRRASSRPGCSAPSARS